MLTPFESSIAERYHEETKYSEEGLQRMPPADLSHAPSPFKEYLTDRAIDLTPFLPFKNLRLGSGKKKARSVELPPGSTLGKLSRLLYFTYGVTGMERVPLTAQTPVARVYMGAARALGLTRTPLFQRRGSGPITVNLALLSPPAVILSGEVQKETPELRFHLGAMLAATIPQYALLFGSPESQAPPTVPHSVSCAASPANHTAFCSGSISTRRAPWPPGAAAEKAPSVRGSLFQRVAWERLIDFFTSLP